MKKITSYLVAVFALASMFLVANAQLASAAPKNLKLVCGTVVSVEEVPVPNSTGKCLKICVKRDDGGIECIKLCNKDCLNLYPAACPVAASCYSNCLEDINNIADTGTDGKRGADAGHKVCFMVAVSRDGKFVHGQPIGEECNTIDANGCPSAISLDSCTNSEPVHLCTVDCDGNPDTPPSTFWSKCFSYAE